MTLEVKQLAEKRMNAEAEANPQVDILWHTVPFQHRDSYALEILAQILSTRTGRLYKGLVLGSGVATETYADQASMKWEGFFNAGGEAKEGHTPEEVEQGIYDNLEKLKKEEVPPEELQKVKNNFAAGEYRRLSSNYPDPDAPDPQRRRRRLARDQRGRAEDSGGDRRRRASAWPTSISRRRTGRWPFTRASPARPHRRNPQEEKQ